MGVGGYALSCRTFNDHVIQGCQLSDHLLGIGDSWAWLRARAGPGHKDVLNRANMWKDPARLHC
jgi:hypothetical protein